MAIIKKLHLRGFKSFAKPVDVEFGKGYNAVLGPNGAGKSNLMDALCFVLGKLSAKSMRAEKSSNLIFNGGKKGNPLSEAEVSLIFSNSDNEFKIGGDEVKLTRVIRQNGNSVYKINDEVRTRQQVVEVLSLAKIDPDGYNIVLQGDIVRFMEMRPEERRMLIEDISGISIYEDRKNKALGELTKVEVKLKETSIILNERDAYLRELKKDRDQALKYKELEGTIKSSKATYLHLQVQERDEALQEVNKKVQAQEEQLKKIDQKKIETTQLMTKKKEDLEDLSKEIEKKGEKEALQLQKEIEDAKANQVRMDERFSTITSEITKVEERKKQLEVNHREVEKTIAELEESRKELESQSTDLREKENKAIAEIKALKERQGSPAELEALEKGLEQAEKNLLAIQQQREGLLRKKFETDAKINTINEKINALSSLHDEVNLKEVLKEYEKVDADLKKMLDEHSLLSSQAGRIREELNEKEATLFKQRAKHTGAKEAASYDLAINKILSLGSNKVYGTINQLGKVDKKYALALEVAAGPRLKSIVVEDDKVASDCIKILKDSKAGIATFLPLNKIKPQSAQPMTGPGVIGSALKLVAFDKKFQDAFAYVLGGTTVVEDLATARKIGVGRCRMVTLEGDLVEVSGAMIGGHRMKRQGISFVEKGDEEQLRQLETEVADVSRRKDILDKRRMEIEESVAEVRKRRSELESEKIKAERMLGTTDLSALQKQLKELKAESVYAHYEKVEKELTQSQEKLRSLREERDMLRKRTSPAEKTHDLDIAESKRQKIREQLVQLQTEVKNIGLQIDNIYVPEQEKILRIIKQHEKERQEFVQEKQVLESKLKEIKKEVQEKEKQEQQFQKDYKNLFTRRNKLHEEIQKAEASITIEDARIKDIQDKINILSINRAKVVAEKETLEKEFDEYKGTKLRTGISLEKLREEIRKAEQMMVEMGNINLRALEIYESILKEYEALVEKVNKLNMEKEDVFKMIAEIDKSKIDMYMKTFNIISKNFARIFSSLSHKGEASAIIENKEDPLNSGVDIRVRITGNKFLDIKSMSGGEKTMAALAFIFAIQEHQPASFYLLDEVDAALDKENSDLLSKLIAKYSETAQYILISHNDTIISEAEYIYGVTMQETNISKIISLKI